MIQTHGTFWLSGFLALPPLDLPTLLSHGMPCSLLLQFPLIPQNASGHPRGATQTRSPVSARCPCGAACRFGFQPAGGLSPGLAPAWREQGPQGKGCRCPLWQREGSDGRPPARAPYCHLQPLLPFLRAHPLRSHRTRCTAPAGPLKQQTWIHLLTVLEAGRPRWSLFLLRPLSPGPHGVSPPCGSEP